MWTYSRNLRLQNKILWKTMKTLKCAATYGYKSEFSQHGNLRQRSHLLKVTSNYNCHSVSKYKFEFIKLILFITTSFWQGKCCWSFRNHLDKIKGVSMLVESDKLWSRHSERYKGSNACKLSHRIWKREIFTQNVWPKIISVVYFSIIFMTKELTR